MSPAVNALHVAHLGNNTTHISGQKHCPNSGCIMVLTQELLAVLTITRAHKPSAQKRECLASLQEDVAEHAQNPTTLLACCTDTHM